MTDWIELPEGEGETSPGGGSLPSVGGTSAKGFSIEEMERIIRRAAELQFEEGGGVEPRDVLAEEEVLRIGGEVGIDARHLRRAVNELQAEGLRPELPRDGKLLSHLIGPASVRATRVVPGDAPEVERRLEEHLVAGESLARLRKRGSRSLWEPAGGAIEIFRRVILRSGGRSYELARAGSVDLHIAPLEEGRTLVTITADVRKIRSEVGIGWMLGLGAVGGVVSGGLGFVVISPLLALPGAAIGAGIGRAAGRGQFGTQLDRVRLAMEGILDRLEAGEPLESRRRPGWRGPFSF